MPLDIKWKLAILAGISECLVFAEAKYCAFDIHGDLKYYVCPRTEYCCNFGCCVSPGFQIYHLWYYWLLVIIMFLVCSGGGWWYRYWLQGRYRTGASAIPHRSYNSRTQNSLRGPTCQAQQARISYNTARNTVLLHRMWKGPHRGATSPAYSSAAASSTHYQSTSVVLSDTNCPYYQLYGPPPSYETVIAQTRGKIPTTMSPEQSRIMLQSPTPNHCFAHSYNLPARIGETPEGIVQNDAMSTSIGQTEVCGHSHHTFGIGSPRPELCSAQNHCPLNGTEGTFRLCRESFRRFTSLSADKSSDMENILQSNRSSPENNVDKKVRGILRIDCASGSRTSRDARSADESISRVHGQSSSMTPQAPKGGSLKLFRSCDKKSTYPRFYDIVRGEESTLSSDASSFQSNPSNNVILAPSNFNVTIDMSAPSTNVNDADERRLLLSAMQGSTNSNLESNRKLDRSRSLD